METRNPKLNRLIEILTEYLSSPEAIKNQSKVMIFTHSRANALLINKTLEGQPRVNANIFVGQSKFKKTAESKIAMDKSEVTIPQEWNQKKQMEILNKFKNYELNTLIATCVGEEGLDIGEVDLIICYDSGFSPIRMVQRMGRTGRKRMGSVIVLLMAGKEEAAYKKSLKTGEKIKRMLKTTEDEDGETVSSRLARNLTFYANSPRMIPDDITPQLKFLTNEGLDAIRGQNSNTIEEESADEDKSDVEGDIDARKYYLWWKGKSEVIYIICIAL